MNSNDPIVLELEARIAEACCLGSEATLSEIQARALTALEPLFAQRFAEVLHVDHPEAANRLEELAVGYRNESAPLPKRKAALWRSDRMGR